MTVQPIQFLRVSEILSIIENPHAYGPWSFQGFGMLRLYLTLDRSLRLHIWDEGSADQGCYFNKIVTNAVPAGVQYRRPKKLAWSTGHLKLIFRVTSMHSLPRRFTSPSPSAAV